MKKIPGLETRHRLEPLVVGGCVTESSRETMTACDGLWLGTAGLSHTPINGLGYGYSASKRQPVPRPAKP